MFDRWSKSISANTAEADANKNECKISSGLLTEIGIYFPSGCKNLARCRVFLGEKPIMPRSAKNYIAANGLLIVSRDLNELITPNMPVLNWFTWNVDTAFNHELWMYANWMSDEQPYQRATYFALSDFITLLKKMFRLE